MNNKVNWFYSLFKRVFLKIKYGKKVRFGHRTKIIGSDIIISNKKGKIVIGDSCLLSRNVEIKSDGGKINIGNNFYINRNSLIVSKLEILIGDNVTIGPNVLVYDHNHQDPRIEEKRKVFIGNNVWIGGNSIILKGVTIGNNAIVGAGSVVTKNIKENEVFIQKR